MDSTLRKKKSFTLPSAYTVLLIITALIALSTQFIPGVESSKICRLSNGTNKRIK